jgi:hypothetical protein
MAIDTSDEGWGKEIVAAERARDARVRVARDLVKKYHTTFFHADKPLSEQNSELDDPSNYVYQYVLTMVPQMVFNNPQVRVDSRKTGKMEAIAAANRQGVNRWIKDKKFYRQLRMAAVDSFFPYGCIGIFQGREDPWPQAVRISQEDFLRDAYALTKQEMRFTGHRWWADKDAMIKRAKAEGDEGGWDLGAIRGMEADMAIKDLMHRGMSNDGLLPKRNELVFYEMVLHGEVMDGMDPDRFPSTIHTLGVCAAGEVKVKQVRKPRPYYGKGPSPYHIFDYGYVPDDTYGLSPVVANIGPAEALNRFWRGTIKAMLAFKNIVLVDDSEPNLAQKITDLDDRSVLNVGGLDKQKVVELSIGGISDKHLATLEALDELLEKNLGLTEAQQGATPKGTTATASQLAASASAIRVEDMEQQFYEVASDCLAGVSWYIWDDERVEFPLDRTAIHELGQIPEFQDQIKELQESGAEITYVGGDRALMGKHDAYEDMELSIQPHSMRRVTEDLGQKRALELLQVVAQIAQFKAAAPDAANWDDLVQTIGDLLNLPDLAKIMTEPQDGGAVAAPPPAPPGAQGAASGGAGLSLVGQQTGAQLAGAANLG